MKSLFFQLLLLVPAVSVSAKTVLVDFNSTSNGDQTTNPAGGLYYNNATLPANNPASGAVAVNGSTSPLALVDTGDVASGWSLSVAKGGGGDVGSAGSGANYTGNYPAAVGAFAATALRDGAFVNNSATFTLTFSGLDSAKTYDLLSYGARGNSGTESSISLLSGTSGSPNSVSFAPLNNATVAPEWTAISPAAGGVIELRINAPASGATGLNFLQLHETDGVALPSIASFTASPGYVGAGGTATLSWQAQGAETLAITPGLGTVTGSSVQVTVQETTDFTLTAGNESGSATATVRVGVGPPRPNVVMILVDDMGVMDTSVPFVYLNGQPVIEPLNQRYRTPNMETLAANGMRFTNASACTICTPSRTSLMTGMNATRHHVTTWTSLATPEDTGDPVHSHNLLPPADWAKAGTDPGGQLLPRLLRDAGYSTISIGKGHFGPNSEPIHDPRAIGFEVNIAGSGLGGPGSYLGTQNFVKSNPAHQVPALEAYWGQDIFLTEVLTQEAKREISTAVSGGKPFFAYMSHYAVHATFEDADPRFSANYPSLSGYQKNFATLVEGMDRSLGDLIQELKDLGTAKDTLIVLMGDNGSDAPIPLNAGGIGPSAPYRGKKGYAYEGGTRVPLLIGWAETDPTNPFQQALPIPGNSVCEDIVAIWDLFPTILGAAGVAAPLAVDGWDLRPYLKVEPGYHRPQEFLLNFPHSHEYQDYYAIYRAGGKKLIYRYATKSYELYDLAVDVGEQNNLAVNPTPEDARILMRLARGMARGLVDLGYQPPRDRLASGNPQTPPVMPAIAGVDADADGIPDVTEDPNSNGLVDPGETDPDNADSDADGTPDGAEFRLGTNPLDATSSFRLHIENLPEGIRLSWPSLPGTSFGIRSSSDLADWSTVVADNFPAAPEPARATSFDVGPPAQQIRFFRVSLD